VRIFTGAVMPAGADTVVMQERAREFEGGVVIAAGAVTRAGQNRRFAGEDLRRGGVVFGAGQPLRPAELGMIASLGINEVTVYRRLRVAFFSTGDELVEPGLPVLDHQIRRSNSHGLAAALALAGYPPGTDLHLPDDLAELQRSLARELDRHDVLVLSGGVSAGRFDHVPAALAALGVQKVFHQVAQRPGRPLWFGTRAPGKLVFALPGNPVSVLVCLARYVIPALAALSGARPAAERTVALARAFEFKAPLTCFLPVTLRYDRDGRTLAEPRPTGGSGDFISLAGTDGFVELPPGPAIHPMGLAVPFHHW